MESISSGSALRALGRDVDRLTSVSLDAPFSEPDFELSIGEPIDLRSSSFAIGDAHDTIVDGPSSGVMRALASQRIGDRIAERYDLVRVIGAGSGGSVYEAIDRKYGEPCAVKLLHEGLRASTDHVARFLHEARIAARIGHEGIVRVLAAGHDDDGTVYQALELLDGEPLAELIDRGNMSDTEIVRVGLELLEALAAAHAHRVIHRDVKPENVFLRKGAGVKLIDFGIAKNLGFDGPAGPTTLEGIALGTPHYMSPEQCRGDRLDERTDLWSTGAVLFHAFSGAPPFSDRSGMVGDEPHRVLMRVAQEAPPSLAELRPDLPPAIVYVIDRALHPRLASRWPSAEAMSIALSAAFED